MEASTTSAARIGPNAIIQTIAALGEAYAPDELRRLLAGAAEVYLTTLPSAMIREDAFHELVELLLVRLGPEAAGAILYRSGERTADYVRANRIPGPVRLLLGLLPAPISLRLLLPAIGKHAWTFAGSGVFRFGLRPRPWVSIASRQSDDERDLAVVLCRYYCGAFTQMLRRLVSGRVTLRETSCQARGGHACVFEIVL